LQAYPPFNGHPNGEYLAREMIKQILQNKRKYNFKRKKDTGNDSRKVDSREDNSHDDDSREVDSREVSPNLENNDDVAGELSAPSRVALRFYNAGWIIYAIVNSFDLKTKQIETRELAPVSDNVLQFLRLSMSRREAQEIARRSGCPSLESDPHEALGPKFWLWNYKTSREMKLFV
jgi:hypothetical protein